MNFLTRFLKIFIFALLLSALAGFAFYEIVIAGNQLRSDISQEQFRQTVYTVVGAWGGFIIFISFVMALLGMKETASVPVHDRNLFLQRVDSAITAQRYRPKSRAESLLVYQPPFGKWLAEKITVQIRQGAATITAPRNLMKKIRQRL